MATVQAIVTGVVSSGIWGAVGASLALGAKPVYKYISTRRPLNRLILRNRRRGVIIVQSAVRNEDHSEYYKYLVTPDCVTGYHLLHQRLLEAGYKPDQIFPRFPGELTNDGLAQSDIVLIGGYENNQISADLNSENDAAYLKDNKIYVQGREAPYDVTVVDKKVRKDYCIVSRRPNSYANGASGDCWILGFEGIRHYGTEAGIRYITAKNLRHPVFKSVESAKNLFVIVSCLVTHVSDSSYSLRGVELEYVWMDGHCLFER